MKIRPVEVACFRVDGWTNKYGKANSRLKQFVWERAWKVARERSSYGFHDLERTWKESLDI